MARPFTRDAARFALAALALACGGKAHTPGGPADAGSSDGHTCDDRGMCVDTACLPGALCDTGDPCVIGRYECDSHPPLGPCLPYALHPRGTRCSVFGTCDDGGACVDDCSFSGERCDTGSICAVGVIECVDGEPACVVAGPATASIPCRADLGECDLEEACDGISTACPADAFEPAGTPCSLGTCDGLGICGEG